MADRCELSPEEPLLRVGVDLRPLGQYEVRGWSRYTIELISALLNLESVDVVGFSDGGNSPSLAALDGVIPIVQFYSRREWFREQVELPRAISQLKIDVFLCTANRGLPFFAPCPTVLTLHDATEWDRSLVDRPEGRSLIRMIYSTAASLASASLIVTVSESARRELVDRLKLPPNRVRVVLEAAGREFVSSPGVSDSEVLKRYGLIRGYVLYVGGSDRKKDLDTLYRAFADLARECTADLVICGSGFRAETVVGRFPKWLRSRIRLLGYVPEVDLPSVYRGARCFVFPAVAEGFGLPALEAMSCGVPVVGANAGALPEIIGDGGQVFERGDSATLAWLLRHLIGDNQSWAKWQAAAIRRSREFSWTKAGEETGSVLRYAATERPVHFVLGRWWRLPRSVLVAAALGARKGGGPTRV